MRVAVIGASGGIGAALVAELTSDGHSIYTVSRNNSASDASCDITDPSAVELLLEQMHASGFAPDCIIIASGIFEYDLVPTYRRSLLNKNFDVNFFGVLNIIDAALPYFRAAGNGHIIAISSIATLRPNKLSVGYPASKAALTSAMKGFDLAQRPHGIAFSVAQVGPTKTRMWEGGESFLAVSPEKVARDIAGLLRSRKAMIYTPFFSTLLARAAQLIPDRLYMSLRKILLG